MPYVAPQPQLCFTGKGCDYRTNNVTGQNNPTKSWNDPLNDGIHFNVHTVTSVWKTSHDAKTVM